MVFLLREMEVSTPLVSSWTFDHEALEVSWHLPASKTDHMALGVQRSLSCMCGVPEFACPYHLAVDHLKWLTGSRFKSSASSPLFPTCDGRMPRKAAVITTFECLGALMGQPLTSPTGIRLFGGHTPRVTGAQTLAALGVDVAKIKILARHSSDAILRYVAEAPLKSLRADLGLVGCGSSSSSSGLPPAFGGSVATSAALRARLRNLEAAMAKLQVEVQTQSQDMVAVAVAFARPDQRIFIQNTVTAAIHRAKPNDDGSTMCGWPFARARKKGAGAPFRAVHSLAGMPFTMICDRCLPTERAIASAVGIAGTEGLSGDEFEEDSFNAMAVGILAVSCRDILCTKLVA